MIGTNNDYLLAHLQGKTNPQLLPNLILVDIDELLLSQPDTGEQALEVTDMLVKSGSLDVIVVDSVAALVPRAELKVTWVTHM